MVIKIFIAWLMTLFLLVFIPVYSCRESSRQEKALLRITNESAERGAKIFISACASCHGQQGEGIVGPALRNTKLEREALFKAITFGRLAQVIPMPPFGEEMGGPLKKHQVEDVVNFIKNWDQSMIAKAQATHAAQAKTSEAKSTAAEKFSPAVQKAPITQTPPAKASKPETSPLSPASPDISSAVATPAEPAVSEQDISQGKELYSNFGCAACHGPEGKGAVGPSILGKNKEEIMRLVRSPRSPAMPPFSPERLSDTDLNKIVNFLNSMGK